jgi:hypothetical protein
MEPFTKVPTVGVVVEVKDGGEYHVLPEFRVVSAPDIRVGDTLTMFGATALDDRKYDRQHTRVTRISHQYSGTSPDPLVVVISVELESGQASFAEETGYDIGCQTVVCSSQHHTK